MGWERKKCGETRVKSSRDGRQGSAAKTAPVYNLLRLHQGTRAGKVSEEKVDMVLY